MSTNKPKSKISYEDIKRIPFRVILNHYGIQLTEKVIAKERKLQGYCPLCHSDKAPHPKKNQFQICLVSPAKPQINNRFHCFACGARGSVTDFVVLKEGLVDWQEVDWAKVSEDRRKGSQENWCPKAALKKASALMAEWFLEYKPGSKDSLPAPQSSPGAT